MSFVIQTATNGTSKWATETGMKIGGALGRGIWQYWEREKAGKWGDLIKQ